MAFKGITFAGQNVRPKDDGALYMAHYGDGILDGCAMTISGDDLVIASGHFIASGRVCHVDGSTNVDLSGRVNQTGYIQVIMNYDLSQGEGSQWYTTFVESATTTFPALTTDDINDTGTLYQIELAVVQVSGGNLINPPYSTMFYSSARAISTTAEIGLAPSDSTSNTFLYGSGGNLIIRPNGRNDGTGQSYFDGNGDFHLGGEQIGGHTFLYDTGTSRTCASGVTYDLATLSVESSGVYLVWGSLQYSLASNTSSYPRLGFGTASKTMLYGTTFYSATTASKYASVSALLSPSGSTLYLVFYGSSSINIDVSDIRIRAIRLG